MLDEEQLAGGNLNPSVTRIGANVHRTAGPWTPSVHQLLDHLESASYPTPRVVGTDPAGREVLTFIPGLCVDPDNLALIDTDDSMRRVGSLISEYHEAQEGFAAAKSASWRAEGRDPSGSNEVIAHNDFAPWNLIVNGTEWTFIDWDMAAPGRRSWDLAWGLHTFVGLWPDSTRTAAQLASRIHAFCDGAGIAPAEIPSLLDVVVERTADHAAMLHRRADAGEQPFHDMVSDGHADIWASGSEFVRTHAPDWLDAGPHRPPLG